MNRYDVTALGELSVYFTESGRSGQGNVVLEANPGGEAYHVLAVLSKLGSKTVFIGKVGNDFFGRQLKKAVIEKGIDASHLKVDENVHTALALVNIYPNGDRDFSFCRNPEFDMILKEYEIPENTIRNSKIFHFGTFTMITERARLATKKAVRIAKEADVLISFAPNLCMDFWEYMDEAKVQILYGLENCQILKITEKEIKWLTRKSDNTESIEWINERYRIPLIFITSGRGENRVCYNGKMVKAESFLQEEAAEAMGEEEAFFGCVLHYILKRGLESLGEK